MFTESVKSQHMAFPPCQLLHKRWTWWRMLCQGVTVATVPPASDTGSPLSFEAMHACDDFGKSFHGTHFSDTLWMYKHKKTESERSAVLIQLCHPLHCRIYGKHQFNAVSLSGPKRVHFVSPLLYGVIMLFVYHSSKNVNIVSIALREFQLPLVTEEFRCHKSMY